MPIRNKKKLTQELSRNCVMTGRMCILDQIRIDQCRKTLDISTSTNFDGRMVAEINFQLIVYSFIEANQSLEEVEEELRLWHNDWGYLFGKVNNRRSFSSVLANLYLEQPTTQFVETGYHYGYFVVLYHWHRRQLTAKAGSDVDAYTLKQDVTDVRRVFDVCDVSMLRRMIRHALKVVSALLGVSDDHYFSTLSDQIHFCGAYTAIMLAQLVETVKRGRRVLDISSTLFARCVQSIEELGVRFELMSLIKTDAAAKYGDGIAQALASCKEAISEADE